MEYRRRRASRTERAEWVGRLERSGQSALSFAKEHDLSAHSLGRWRRQVRAGVGASSDDPVPVFHTVSLSGSVVPDWAAEVELASGRRVRFRAGVPGSWMRELVEALR